MTHAEQSVPTEGRTINWPHLYDLIVKVVSLGREPRFRREIVGVVAPQAGERVLDVGCGTGTLALALARAVGENGRVYGIDPAAAMVTRARTKAEKAGVAAEFKVGAIESLDFPDESLDVVVSTLVWHHLTSRLQGVGLQEIHRVLVPGGRLVIVDFGREGPGQRAVVEAVRVAGFASPTIGRVPPTFYSLVARNSTDG
jgi:ubiquinone/menaquinone biosynthesis C-methylase UbiE